MIKKYLTEKFDKKRYPNQTETSTYVLEIDQSKNPTQISMKWGENGNWVKPGFETLTLKSDGNGLKLLFHDHRGLEEDRVIELDYCQASDIAIVLNEYHKQSGYNQVVCGRKDGLQKRKTTKSRKKLRRTSNSKTKNSRSSKS